MSKVRCIYRCSALVFILGLSIALASPRAQAIPITYTFTGTGTGNIDGTPFTDAPYTVTMSGDTSAVIPFVIPVVGFAAFTNPTTGTIAVQGIGVATITEPNMHVARYPSASGQTAFFWRPYSETFLDASNPALTGYTLITPIGPVLGSEVPDTSDFMNIASDLGAITMTSSSPVTFQAFTTCGNGMIDPGDSATTATSRTTTAARRRVSRRRAIPLAPAIS